MDATRIDRLARALGSAPSRRGFAVGFAGIALKGVLDEPFRAVDAGARKKHKKKKKCKGKKRCGKGCIAKTQCCTGGKPGCSYNEACDGGACMFCLGASCERHSDCCTLYCADSAGGVCICWPANSGPAEGCTNDRQCCNGSCNEATGLCACSSNGLPCGGDDTACCSGFCDSANLCAPAP